MNESVITNDFLFKSNEHVNYGISSKYDILLKNTNTHSNNSSNFEDNSNYNLYGTFKIDNSYPLINKTENFTNYLNQFYLLDIALIIIQIYQIKI